MQVLETFRNLAEDELHYFLSIAFALLAKASEFELLISVDLVENEVVNFLAGVESPRVLISTINDRPHVGQLHHQVHPFMLGVLEPNQCFDNVWVKQLTPSIDFILDGVIEGPHSKGSGWVAISRGSCHVDELLQSVLLVHFERVVDSLFFWEVLIWRVDS